MARIRTIKPEWCDDERLASISVAANFVGVMVLLYSDDFGVVQANPVWLRNKIFPMRSDISDKEFAGWLKELESICYLRPFEAEGKRFYLISGFKKHQRVDKPNLSTRNPEPPSDILDAMPQIKTVDKPKPDKAPKTWPEPIVDLTTRLVARIRTTDANARIPSDLSSWHDEIDKLHRLDNRAPDLIAAVIDFAHENEFWRAHILSAKKLREKFGSLYVQYNKTHNGKHSTNGGRNSPTIANVANALNWGQ